MIPYCFTPQYPLGGNPRSPGRDGHLPTPSWQFYEGGASLPCNGQKSSYLLLTQRPTSNWARTLLIRSTPRAILHFRHWRNNRMESVREFATASLQVKLADLLRSIEAPGERLLRVYASFALRFTAQLNS